MAWPTALTAAVVDGYRRSLWRARPYQLQVAHRIPSQPDSMKKTGATGPGLYSLNPTLPARPHAVLDRPIVFLTTIAAMPASTALAIGDDSMSGDWARPCRFGLRLRVASAENIPELSALLM